MEAVAMIRATKIMTAIATIISTRVKKRLLFLIADRRFITDPVYLEFIQQFAVTFPLQPDHQAFQRKLPDQIIIIIRNLLLLHILV